MAKHVFQHEVNWGYIAGSVVLLYLVWKFTEGDPAVMSQLAQDLTGQPS